jgi:V-type H+-transporting ATPase subunit d
VSAAAGRGARGAGRGKAKKKGHRSIGFPFVPPLRHSHTHTTTTTTTEGIVRGHKAGLLTSADYAALFQAETLEDVKLNLAGTDYGHHLAASADARLTPSTIVDAATAKLVADWASMRAAASGDLATFMDLCTHGHMIDNVVLVVSGTLHDRDVQDLLDKAHPLGRFDGLASLAVATSVRDLYTLVLCDTPLEPYFTGAALSADDLDEMHVEVLRNTLYRAYLDAFAAFCAKLGGATAELMGGLLAFEADRRALNITLNSLGTDLTRDDRRRLYSSLGALYPHGHAELASADDFEAIRAAMERCPPYRALFTRLGYGEAAAQLDKVLFEEEARRCALTFERQFHYAIFYAYMRLREQEVRNLMWVAECVAQDQKARAPDGVVFLF